MKGWIKRHRRTVVVSAVLLAVVFVAVIAVHHGVWDSLGVRIGEWIIDRILEQTNPPLWGR